MRQWPFSPPIRSTNMGIIAETQSRKSLPTNQNTRVRPIATHAMRSDSQSGRKAYTTGLIVERWSVVRPAMALPVDEIPQACSSTPRADPNNLKLAVPAEPAKLCTHCHERIVGRPAQQPQIVVADHAGTQQCTVCHNAHSPRLGLVVAAAPASSRSDASVGKVKAVMCTGCH